MALHLHLLSLCQNGMKPVKHDTECAAAAVNLLNLKLVAAWKHWWMQLNHHQLTMEILELALHLEHVELLPSNPLKNVHIHRSDGTVCQTCLTFLCLWLIRLAFWSLCHPLQMTFHHLCPWTLSYLCLSLQHMVPSNLLCVYLSHLCLSSIPFHQFCPPPLELIHRGEHHLKEAPGQTTSAQSDPSVGFAPCHWCTLLTHQAWDSTAFSKVHPLPSREIATFSSSCTGVPAFITSSNISSSRISWSTSGFDMLKEGYDVIAGNKARPQVWVLGRR